MKCQVDAIQWEGVVAEFFRGLQKLTRFSGGGSTMKGPFYIFRLSQGGGPI